MRRLALTTNLCSNVTMCNPKVHLSWATFLNAARLLKCQIFANYPIFIAATWKTTKAARKVRYNNTERVAGSIS